MTESTTVYEREYGFLLSVGEKQAIDFWNALGDLSDDSDDEEKSRLAVEMCDEIRDAFQFSRGSKVEVSSGIRGSVLMTAIKHYNSDQPEQFTDLRETLNDAMEAEFDARFD